jgi:ATP phosphoribosyltransferase
MSKLKIALSKGSLLEPVIDCLATAGFDIDSLKDPGRRLLLETDDAEYIISRAADVPTFVEWGAVDIGFVGSDVLMEGDYNVFELLDMGVGPCNFVLAGRPASVTEEDARPEVGPGSSGAAPFRVATKYPRVAAEYLARRGRQAEIIKLYGSMELAPLVGLADEIIDLSSTGRTLAENGLVIIEEIAPVTCRLIANYVSYKLKSAGINELVEQLKAVREEN